MHGKKFMETHGKVEIMDIIVQLVLLQVMHLS